ncbi:adipokinetic hormone/corazonin-related peptide receptor variant I-like [Paramacrobiotus metropolitanus]|uniref:adipokinetic hormone/corazonin-related peptide receptor variant I-like n=1 Tax=Paramacrobiotus metropolitanus TaxID=2943436 RepID=UPI0024458641|nr:adipokinetic hormone/corazonin-related peptide receptor variant I-like [Paramacrobiotus metropolitanus]
MEDIFGNMTRTQQERQESFFAVYNATTRILTGCVALAVLLNAGFLALVLHATRIHGPTTIRSNARLRMMLLNLVAADLFICFFTLVLELGWRMAIRWRAGEVACRILNLTKTMGLYAESYVVLAMCVDHYYSVRRPIPSKERYERAKTLVALGWMAAFVFSVPQAIVYHVEYMDPDYTQCVHSGSFISLNAEHTYIAFGLIAVYVLPLSIMLPLTGLLLHKACRAKPKPPRPHRLTRVSISINVINEAGEDQEMELDGDDDWSEYEIGSRYSLKTLSSEQGDTPATPARDRLNTGLQLRHTDTSIRREARYRVIKLALVVLLSFITSHTPYVVLVTQLAVAENNPSKDDVVLQISDSLMIVSLGLSALLNPIFYGVYLRTLSVKTVV